ncbi:hypothetical protein IWQ62_002752 [Dispira parvispora]|uniref:ubiquitinyl hydrolase 1 n=1 Tax=Dispira parvispora TaxID=1520584 RepID=A0A9W8APU5_9FUNG|nr:hypothetical protein IWQ62_002752 [Dispira parvispora]
MTSPVYHERQTYWLCAKLQGPVFQSTDLEKMADDLAQQANEIRSSWWNPHKWLWGFGNYDINVITRALEQHQLDIKWFDQRKAYQQRVCQRTLAILRVGEEE